MKMNERKGILMTYNLTIENEGEVIAELSAPTEEMLMEKLGAFNRSHGLQN